MIELDLLSYALLVLTALTAGFVDSIAGGGGLITVPMLMAFGIPPHLALGTNKLQSCFGSLTATTNYARKGLVSVSKVWQGILWTAIGAAMGTWIIQLIDALFLEKFIPFLLVSIFVYTLFSPQMGANDRQGRLQANLFYLTFGLGIGFYDGFFGPGTGSFWTIAFVALLGLNLKKATAHTKVMNFTSNIVSLLVFILGGKVMYPLGICMGMGQILGAYLGSHLVIRFDTRFVKVFFLTVVAVTILKMSYTIYF